MYENWVRLKKLVDQSKAALIAEEAVIYTHLKDKLTDEGTTTILEGNWKVKITTGFNRTIDQAGAEQLGGIGLAKKYSWSKTEYNKLSDIKKLVVDAVITSKPKKPGFKVELNEII